MVGVWKYSDFRLPTSDFQFMHPQLLETIQLSDGQFQNTSYHWERMKRSLWETSHLVPAFDLKEYLSALKSPSSGLYKARLLYREAIEKIEWFPYVIRPLASLQIVNAPWLDYAHKWRNRKSFKKLISWKGNADDILIVQHGQLRDLSYANIALYDGQDWWTPEQPLLPGTCRARLLAEGRLKTAALGVEDLPQFQYLSPINALMDLGEGPRISIDAIQMTK